MVCRLTLWHCCARACFNPLCCSVALASCCSGRVIHDVYHISILLQWGVHPVCLFDGHFSFQAVRSREKGKIIFFWESAQTSLDSEKEPLREYVLTSETYSHSSKHVAWCLHQMLTSSLIHANRGYLVSVVFSFLPILFYGGPLYSTCLA